MGAHFDAPRDLLVQFGPQPDPRHRAEPGFFPRRVTLWQCLCGGDETPGKFLEGRFFHDNPFGCDANLATILEPRLYCGRNDTIEIGVGQHDERVVLTKLQQRLFEVPPGFGCNRRSRSHARRHRNTCDARNIIATYGQRVEHALGHTRFGHGRRQRTGGTLHIVGMFEDKTVAASHDRYSGPQDLPEWKIPRHHSEYQAQRQIGDACVSIRADIRLFVRQ